MGNILRSGCTFSKTYFICEIFLDQFQIDRLISQNHQVGLKSRWVKDSSQTERSNHVAYFI